MLVEAHVGEELTHAVVAESGVGERVAGLGARAALDVFGVHRHRARGDPRRARDHPFPAILDRLDAAVVEAEVRLVVHAVQALHDRLLQLVDDFRALAASRGRSCGCPRSGPAPRGPGTSSGSNAASCARSAPGRPSMGHCMRAGQRTENRPAAGACPHRHGPPARPSRRSVSGAPKNLAERERVARDARREAQAQVLPFVARQRDQRVEAFAGRPSRSPSCTSAPASAAGIGRPSSSTSHRPRAFAGGAQHEVHVLGLHLARRSPRPPRRRGLRRRCSRCRCRRTR